MDDFNTVQSNITSALVATTRNASELAGEDLPFYRSLDTSLSQALDRHNARLLGLAERLLGVATANTETVRPPRLRDLDSVESDWKAVVDVIDSLLERADTALDEFTGAVKRLSPGAEQAMKAVGSSPYKKSRIADALKDLDIEKPQLHFETVPTNRETPPFRPLLLSKPHAQNPLVLEPLASENNSQPSLPHPYQIEIETYKYPPSMYTQSEPITYRPFESTAATFVDSEEALEEMLEELKQAKEIAIDLEHHDNRSYIGIVCLMQISTRDRDWIVDTLKPWRRKLQCLNSVFADPNIIKVLHGAYMDIIWLQRDLGLYIVGLFDTHYASRALAYSGGSIAFLLKKFANVDAQKQYQMADWRIRPLPQELLEYARSDTHYLLYIFDCMRNELIAQSDFSLPDYEGDKFRQILLRSSEVALQRYEHPVYDAELGQGSFGWYKLLSRTPILLKKEQFAVFRAVHRWRDTVAREQDDSVHYVMPNHVVFAIAKAMPTTRSELLTQGSTQTIRLRVNELLAIIIEAKEAGKSGPEMEDLLDFVKPSKKTRDAAANTSTDVSNARLSPAHHSLAIMNNTLQEQHLPLRSAISSFWGSAFGSSVWQQKRSSSSVSLAVPLPPLTAEVFTTPADTVLANPPHDIQAENLDQPVEEESQASQFFVLKDLNKKRKHNPIDNMAAQSDEVAISEPHLEHAQQKAELRRARKAAKRAAKANAVANEHYTSSSAADTEEPFDYAAAPDLLGGPKDNAMTAKERKKKERQLNPYAKSLDTPKGLPRVQKESAGRSMTYKS